MSTLNRLDCDSLLITIEEWDVSTDLIFRGKIAAYLLTELCVVAGKSLVNACNTWRTLSGVAFAPVVAEMSVLMLLTLTFLALFRLFEWFLVFSFQPADLYFF